MNTPYKFQYRRRFLWKSIIVIGHQYLPDQGKMVVFFPNGSILEIANWHDCECRLGTDWVNATKRMQEAKAGREISLAVGK